MIIPKKALFATIATAGISFVGAECPNACSGHGECSSHDMCSCDRNWQGADCSQRTCPFGLAHVDLPKGDLNFDQQIGNFNEKVIENSITYPYGTTEGFPHMVDTDGIVIDNTAHDYSECSNKGVCDRSIGMCDCLPGYDGAACQRASCPNDITSNKDRMVVQVSADGKAVSRSVTYGAKNHANVQTGQCSGHGTCESISKLANIDNGNIYSLWDKDITMGCSCDAGWGAADCSERMCKYGIDPLYTDDTTARVTQTAIRIESSDASALAGQYALVFYDVFGEDYVTKPLDVDGTGVFGGVNVCDAVTAALIELPNGVVPAVECSYEVLSTNKGFEYTLTFIGNPGELKELEINQHLDGARPTITVNSGTYSADVHTKVTGEFTDHFSERCEGIEVQILADSLNSDDSWTSHVRPGSLGYLAHPSGAFTTAQKKKLKACLGDADSDTENNVDVSNWDRGFVKEANDGGSYHMIGAFPHAIKVVPVESTTNYDKYMNGHYHLVWYDENAEGDNKEFRVANLNDGSNVLGEGQTYYVYTTKGTVQQMGYGDESPQHKINDNDVAGSTTSSTRITGYFDKYSNKIYTNYDASCKNNPEPPSSRNHVCVEKGDKMFVIDSCWGIGDLDSSGDPIGNPIFGGSLISGCPTSQDVNFNTGNLYTVTKVYTVPVGANTTIATDTVDISGDSTLKRSVDTNIIEVNSNIGWRGWQGDPENSNSAVSGVRDNSWSDNTGIVFLFHFNPVKEGSYDYTSMCSNRGACNKGSGICECFKGYTKDDCSLQSSLAM